MSQTILIGVAWPYANGSLHLGHIAGAYLPADIFARYNRIRGNRVLMVSGSDVHGTPVTIRAEQEGVAPQVIVDRFHSEFLRCWEGLGISFDLYTTTGTKNHEAVTQDMFLTLHRKGYIYEGAMSQPYCPKDKRFLPDRYVEGTCPFCGNLKARGDQCDNCGRTLNPEDLKDLRCRLCGTTPEFQESRHFFLKLSAFQEPLLKWLEDKSYWRPAVVNFTRGFLGEGLRDRAITRDISWGIPIPLPGWEDKRIYVWFEAVIGYFSAAVEWAKLRGQPELWREWWQDPSSRVYNFIGKDNIPFHTVIWPAMLMGYGGMDLPYDVPANEFMNFGGAKASKSTGVGVTVPDVLAMFDPDPVRYFIAANMPETSDSDFTWPDFIRRNNDELVGTYGNLANRVLSFSHRSFGGKLPEPGPIDAESQAVLDALPGVLASVGESLSACRFRDGLQRWMAFAQSVNKYIDTKAPWKAIKTDPESARTSLWVCANALSCLATATYPYLPFTSQRLHEMLGNTGSVQERGWTVQPVKGGQPIPKPSPLFAKLDGGLVADGVPQHVAV